MSERLTIRSVSEEMEDNIKITKKRTRREREDVIKNIYGDIGNGDFKCHAGCGAIMNINTKKILHMGHIQAHAKGGADSLENLRPECGPCNQSHSTENMFDRMKRHNRQPPVPDEAFEAHTFDKSKALKAKKFDLERPIIHECKEKCEKYYDKYGKLHGIISAPTGSGKTVIALMVAANIMRKLGGGLLLWITERKDIITTQFTEYNIMSWKEAGIIPRETSIQFGQHLQYCDKFPQYCIIASTIDTAMSTDTSIEEIKQYYRKLLNYKNFVGVVIDETHMAQGDKTYKMIQELIPSSTIMLGLSATHKFNSTMDAIYGGGADPANPKITPENIFLEYSYMQAINDGVIRGVDFKISQAVRKSTGEQNACLFDRISVEDRRKVYNYVIEICRSTPNKKGLMWCGEIEAADKWCEYFRNTGKSENCEIEFIIDHSNRICPTKTFKRFCEEGRNIIMITAIKHSQGVDIKGLDFAILIDGKSNRDARVILQMVGRLMRKSDDNPNHGIFCEFMVTETPKEYEENMKKFICNYSFGISERSTPIDEKYRIAPENFRAGIGGAGDRTVRVIYENGTEITFEILDGLTDITILERDEIFIANLLCRTGHCEIGYEGIKNFLKTNKITEPGAAERLFCEMHKIREIERNGDIFEFEFEGNTICVVADNKTFKGICNWWEAVRYMGINYNKLLDIDSGKYYKTLEEAKKAINIAERSLLWNDVYGKTDRAIYDLLCVVDIKLHINPVGFYEGLSNFSEYYSPNRKKWIIK